MSNIDIKGILLEQLGYADSSTLVPYHQYDLRRPIPDIEDVYLVDQIPVAYFSRFADADPTRIRELHQRVWNESKAPLLYVVLPTEIRVYNGYASPARDNEHLNDQSRLLRQLQQIVTVEDARQQIYHQLETHSYNRLNIDTGAFWNTGDGQSIDRANRADSRLLKAMGQLRRHLLQAGLPNPIAYSLLGRSIFTRYLVDRTVLDAQQFAAYTAGRHQSFRETLDDIDATYLLFDGLNQRFNGDLFPVSEQERRSVQPVHLNLLSRFLDGHDLDSGQLALPFWPYDFKYIPIELISGIYDTFLETEQRQDIGAYYTPLSLVDFVLDETLSSESTHERMTLLDPACGSGVFLVRGFQLIVEAWIRNNGGFPAPSELASILRHSIFGVDVSPEAVDIAAFSLYLSLLSYLSADQIRAGNFRFPSIKGSNLLTADFFDPAVDSHLAGKRFDRVIGNPPWGRGTLSGPARRYVEQNELDVGGMTIVQAFLYRAPDFCAADGEVALLAPAKSTIHVTSETHQAFRRQFFNRYDVHTLINFSALVYELFPESLSPVIALFYKPDRRRQADKIAYAVPKPSAFSQRLGAIVLDATEVRFLDRQELDAHPELWKIALWGTLRDAVLIEQLKSLPTLSQQSAQLGWHIGEGIIVGNARQYAPWLKGKLLIPTEKLQPYVVDMSVCEPIDRTTFERPRTPERFQAPLVLVSESQRKAAFSANDIVYKHNILGVSGEKGQETLLKWLAAFINTALAQYYLFLTSARWAIERGNITQNEYEALPFVVPDDNDPRLSEIVSRFNQIVDLQQQDDPFAAWERDRRIREHEQVVENLVFDIFELTSTQRQLVHDTVDYGIEYFSWSKRKGRAPNETPAVQSPDLAMLQRYAEVFSDAVGSFLRYQGQALNGVVYIPRGPLCIVGFAIVDAATAEPVEVVDSDQTFQQTMRRLNRLLSERRTATQYVRRHLRIYDGPRLYLIRPSEQRFWTQSQAHTDADDVIAETISSPQVQPNLVA